MIKQIAIDIRNKPLVEVNNFCMEYDCSLNIDQQAIILMEIEKEMI